MNGIDFQKDGKELYIEKFEIKEKKQILIELLRNEAYKLYGLIKPREPQIDLLVDDLVSMDKYMREKPYNNLSIITFDKYRRLKRKSKFTIDIIINLNKELDIETINFDKPYEIALFGIKYYL